jgi:hypothetical protein
LATVWAAANWFSVSVKAARPPTPAAGCFTTNKNQNSDAKKKKNVLRAHGKATYSGIDSFDSQQKALRLRGFGSIELSLLGVESLTLQSGI